MVILNHVIRPAAGPTFSWIDQLPVGSVYKLQFGKGARKANAVHGLMDPCTAFDGRLLKNCGDDGKLVLPPNCHSMATDVRLFVQSLLILYLLSDVYAVWVCCLLVWMFPYDEPLNAF